MAGEEEADLKRPDFTMALVEGTVLKLEPGDRLFVRVPKTWSRERADLAHHVVKHWAGPGIRILFGTDDMELTVVRDG